MSRIDPNTEAAWQDYCAEGLPVARSGREIPFTATLTYRHLEALRVTDADKHRVYVQLAKAERTLATAPPGSSRFLIALAEALRLRPLVRGY